MAGGRKRIGVARRGVLVCATLAIVVVTAVLAGSPELSAAPAPEHTRQALDLAAIALTPIDLAGAELPGYGVHFTTSVGPDEMAANASEWVEAGARRAYYRALRLPSESGPGGAEPTRDVSSYVLEYASEEAAIDGFDLFDDHGDRRDGTDRRQTTGVGTLGDEWVMARWGALGPGLLDVTESVSVAFRQGNLTATVLIEDYANNPPDIGQAQVLAERLRDRMETVFAGAAPDLSTRALRLQTDVIGLSDDYYALLDGDFIRSAWDHPADTAEAVAAGEAGYAGLGATDAYEVRHRFVEGEMGYRYFGDLYRFPTSRAAAAWVDAYPAWLERLVAIDDVEAVIGFPDYGDASGAWTAVAEPTDRGPAHVYRTAAIRVDNVVATISLLTPRDAPPETFAALVAAQTACLEGRACLDPMPVPDGLRRMIPTDQTPDDGLEIEF